MSIELILIRHAQTAWNRARLVQGGQSDPDLDEVGHSQAQKLALSAVGTPMFHSESLRGVPIRTLYCSPLRRATQTAAPLADVLGIRVEIEPSLMEINTGDAEGLPVDQLREKHPQFWQDWANGASTLRWPGGESLDELQKRTARLLERLRADAGGGTVAVVGHTFSLLVLMLQALGWNVGLYYRFRLEVASISILEMGANKATLLSLNDTCHWKQG